MQKIYLKHFIFGVGLFCFFSAQAQRNSVRSGEIFSQRFPASTNLKTPGIQADCDTINNPLPTGWTPNFYYFGLQESGGYAAGTNQFNDKEKAQYFDLSATAYSYITGARFYFARANSNVPDNLATTINFKVYEDNGGTPGKKLGNSFSVPLSQVKADLDAGKTTDIVFPDAIVLPVSKKFYVSMDVSSFKWVPGTGKVTKDSISLLSTANGDPGALGAWEMGSDNLWYDFSGSPEFLNVALLILPYVSVGTTGCIVLPVKLLSFNAERKNSDVTLSWKISAEINMKQYEVQRADNNGNFKTVATLHALNSLKDQSYAVTDKNAFNLSSSVQYRLKQVDGDGSVTYSRIITVKSNAAITDISFANPFNGALKLQLNLATAQQVAVNVYDMQGKLVVSEKTKTYNASANTIILNATGNLKSGLYVIKVNAGTEQAVYKVVKN